MSIAAEKIEQGPPLGRAATLTGRISRLLLLVICAGPIAVFPIGLAYKGYVHFFGTTAPTGAIQALETPQLPG